MLDKCPFCRSEDAPRIYDLQGNGVEQVVCYGSKNGKSIGCGATGPIGRVKDRDKVIAEWNKRS